MSVPHAHRIVILGAGFGGLRTALELLKRRVRLGNATITLVDANAQHVYTPLLYEVAMGCLESKTEDATCALCEGACLLYANNPYLHRKDEKIRFVQGRVEGIDWDAHLVRLEGRDPLEFDDIILAVGGESATFSIPGVEKHTVGMKTLEDALNIHRHIASAVEDLKNKKRNCLDLVVVGGGPNGCEASAELGFSLQRMAREGRIPHGCFSVTLVDASPNILGMFSPRTRALALDRLAGLGVQVKTDKKVLEIKAEGVVLPDGLLPASVVVWAGGMKPRAFVKEWGFPVDDRGFVQVDATFAVQNIPHAWALGDCALIKHPVTGARVPALGQAAAKEAATLAENITRILERKPTITFLPPAKWATIVPLGGAWAVADLGIIHLTGWPGYACRKAADLFYFFSILPVRVAGRLWVRGLAGFFRLR